MLTKKFKMFTEYDFDEKTSYPYLRSIDIFKQLGWAWIFLAQSNQTVTILRSEFSLYIVNITAQNWYNFSYLSKGFCMNFLVPSFIVLVYKIIILLSFPLQS